MSTWGVQRNGCGVVISDEEMGATVQRAFSIVASCGALLFSALALIVAKLYRREGQWGGERRRSKGADQALKPSTTHGHGLQ